MVFAGFCQPTGPSNLIEIDGKACTHQVAWPPGHEGATHEAPPVLTKPMAKQYPFEIDPFQKTAIAALEAGDSVLVAAHTSAGKTVVAQYAMAMALRDKTRVIYTSPLKALSNQKYREFYEEFADVGLMTGDVTINPNASCLVMTTEILRSMLYYGSEIVREVQLLVYDEIHYIKDKERGVVWEESIILLPNQCQYAFLSATIPNAFEFAQWIANTHLTKCHVVYTDYRPVPLHHYIMPAGGKKMFLVVEEKGRFREDNYQKAIAAVTDTDIQSGQDGKRQKKETGKGENSDIYRLVMQLSEQDCHPVIVFAFSKRECEALAQQLTSMVLNDEEEQKLLEGIFWNAVDVLSEDDRRLPQITNALPMLKRGIGVHHSGLLPIVKEVIEILFQEGLVKVLFATETFSTGLNMPAKCVVFASVRKFDGVGFRSLTGGEYIQMSGRAGRRGLDDRGIVVLMMDQKMEPAVAKTILRGAPDPMLSEFRLSYNMLLNILRLDVAELRPEALISRSLRQWQMQVALPALKEKLAALNAAAEDVEIESEVDVDALFHLLEEHRALDAAICDIANLPQFSLPFLQPGRLARVMLPPAVSAPGVAAEPIDVPGTSLTLPPMPSDDDVPSTMPPGVWAAVVNFERIQSGSAASTSKDSSQLADAEEVLQGSYIVDILVRATPESLNARKSDPVRLLPHTAGDDSVCVVAAIPLTQIHGLSTVRVILPKDLRPSEARDQGMKTLSEAVSRLVSKFKRVPLLDRDKDLKVKTSAYKKLKMKAERTRTLLEAHPLFAHEEKRHQLLKLLIHKRNIQRLAAAVKRDVKQAESMILKDELKQRMRVLRRLGYISEEGVVSTKGHVAAVLQTGHELVLTELLFNGTLKQLSEIQLASLLSCFVWSEAADSAAKVREDMEASFAALRDAARLVGRVQAESGMVVDLEGFVATFRPDLLDPVMLWASGSSFLQVAKTTTIFEGSLVRAIRRLDELLRQLVTGCQIIGDVDFAARVEGASKRIHRDVIFAASLYL